MDQWDKIVIREKITKLVIKNPLILSDIFFIFPLKLSASEEKIDLSAIEYLLNPVRKIRQQIQNCITGNGTIFNNNQEMQILLNTQARTYLNKQISLINEKILNLTSLKQKYNDRYNYFTKKYLIYFLISSLNGSSTLFFWVFFEEISSSINSSIINLLFWAYATVT